MLYSELEGIELSRFTQELNIPVEFSTKDNHNILRYLRQQLEDVTVEVKRVKVMLVGPGEVGKTTLVHRLKTGAFQPAEFPMTDGIEMQEWKHEDVDFQLWDFGGQNVYSNTHAMFFDNRSVFVVLWNPSASYVAVQCVDSALLLEQYFQHVRNRAPDAPIVLVSTHADELYAVPRALVEDLRHRHGRIVAYHSIDSKSGFGVAELKAKLVEVALSQPYVSPASMWRWKRS